MGGHCTQPGHIQMPAMRFQPPRDTFLLAEMIEGEARGKGLWQQAHTIVYFHFGILLVLMWPGAACTGHKGSECPGW
jgi:hypothetical protein